MRQMTTVVSHAIRDSGTGGYSCALPMTDALTPARALLAAAPEADDLEVATPQGSVFAARSDDHAVVVVCGRFALPALVRFDLRMVLGDLAGARRDVA